MACSPWFQCFHPERGRWESEAQYSWQADLEGKQRFHQHDTCSQCAESQGLLCGLPWEAGRSSEGQQPALFFGYLPLQVWCQEEDTQCIWRVHSTYEDIHSFLHTWAWSVHVEDDEVGYASQWWYLGVVEQEDYDFAEPQSAW